MLTWRIPIGILVQEIEWLFFPFHFNARMALETIYPFLKQTTNVDPVERSQANQFSSLRKDLMLIIELNNASTFFLFIYFSIRMNTKPKHLKRSGDLILVNVCVMFADSRDGRSIYVCVQLFYGPLSIIALALNKLQHKVISIHFIDFHLSINSFWFSLTDFSVWVASG